MEEQHGFRPGRSTITRNTFFCNFLFEDFSAHSQVDVIHTDFDKTFDQVNHLALLSILQETGFGKSLLSCFRC